MRAVIFWWITLLQFWAPIPVGSNTPWSWNILNILIFIAFALHLSRSWSRPSKLTVNKTAWIVLAPLIITQLVVIVQIIPGLGNTLGPLIGNYENLPLKDYKYLSLDVYQSQELLIRGLALCAYAYLLFRYLADKIRIKQFQSVVVFSGIFQATYAVILVLTKWDTTPLFGLPYAERANGSFVYHNHLANYLVLCISAAMALMVSELGKSDNSGRGWLIALRGIMETLISTKIIIRLGIIVMIIALIMTKSRMGNSGFFAALAIVGAFSLFFYKRAPTSLKYIIISIFVLDIIIVGAIFGIDKVKERVENTSMVSEARDDVLVDGIHIVKDYPLLGTGAGSFYGVFPAYQTAPYSGFYDHAHNDYLQFAVEYGVPVTLLLGLMWLACIIKNFHTMLRGRGSFNRAIAFGLNIALIHMLFHATVDFGLQAPANALLFIALLALSWIRVETKKAA